VRGFTPPLVKIIDQDGRIVAKAIAKLEESTSDPVFTPATFLIDLDQSCFGRGERRLTAMVDDQAFALTSCNLILEGNIDQVREDSCSGWLFSPSAPQRNFEIEIFRNGTSVGVARCQMPRADVKAAFPTCQNPGFAKLINAAPPTALEFTTMTFRFPGSDVELFDGPYVLASRAATVVAARRVSRLARDKLLTVGERAVLQAAITAFLSKSREIDHFIEKRQFIRPSDGDTSPRLNVIIPIYRGVDITRDCIESVLAHRTPALDRVVLINDHSPDAEMAEMLRRFLGLENVFVLNNSENLGFVKTVNRGLSFCTVGDVVLLNSDTTVFAGCLEEMWSVGQSSPSIGTVTAMSNNATIFSYPHVDLRVKELDDISWEDLAAIALAKNRGMTIDVPTGHGFCLLLKRQVLQRLGSFDESFGRGYGEENDFCARAADLGFRNVMCPSVFAEHKESISFLDDKAALLALNTTRLEAMYPEYTPIIMEVERRDDPRQGRWALDSARLRAAGDAGKSFALIVQHALGGGTSKAISDIERAVGYNGASRLTLSCRADGFLELTAKTPSLRAVFAPDEISELFSVLSAAPISLVLIHQIIGYPLEFAEHMIRWVRDYHSVFYAHDFYALCQRVTMIDATGQFCRVASTEICSRCISVGKAHEASQFGSLPPAEHRRLFTELFRAVKHVVTPSENAAGYLRQAFPGSKIEAVPHPEAQGGFPNSAREGNDDEILLLGAIGPHKGSGKLLEIAKRAKLTHPWLYFRVIGYTDIDEQLIALGNVNITGPYKAADLDRLFAQCLGRLALFLSIWPETYSYALSEVARHGFIPVVPDLGAPAERVRAAGFGVVFPFPIDAERTLECLGNIKKGLIPVSTHDIGPASLVTRDYPLKASKSILTPETAPDAHPFAPIKLSMDINGRP